MRRSLQGGQPVDDDLVLRNLVRLPLVLMRPAGRPLETLEQAFVFAEGCVCRVRLEALLLRRRLEIRLVELGSVEAIIGCVTAGTGVTLLPAALCTTHALEQDAAGTLDLRLVYRRESEAKADLLAQGFRNATLQSKLNHHCKQRSNVGRPTGA